MNLHGIVAPYIGAVNPMIPVSIRISTGPSAPAADGSRSATYATPGAITASITGDVLDVSAIGAGSLFAGQELAGVGVLPKTAIEEQITGAPGKIGTYRLNRSYAAPVASGAMTTDLVMMAQVQPITWRDLQQLDGINMNGERRKIYLYGSVDGVSRVNKKGGDLIAIAGGQSDGTWLVAQVLEQWPDWVAAACTLQNGS